MADDLFIWPASVAFHPTDRTQPYFIDSNTIAEGAVPLQHAV